MHAFILSKKNLMCLLSFSFHCSIVFLFPARPGVSFLVSFINLFLFKEILVSFLLLEFDANIFILLSGLT